MNKHLGIESSFNFHQADGELIDREKYRVLKTRARPHFFWGNYLIFKEAPSEANFQEWIDSYNLEFDTEEQGFITMTWSSSEIGNPVKFLDFGFKIETQEVLRLEKLISPIGLNDKVEVRIINTEDEWGQIRSTQWIQDWPIKQSQDHFLNNKIATYRRLQDQGFGFRYGAFIEEKLVGDLGIYFRENIGRFNNVFTHADYYNQGICRTLVYESLKDAINKKLASEFVMQTTENEYAKNIYRKVGFSVCGKSHDMTWMSSKWS